MNTYPCTINSPIALDCFVYRNKKYSVSNESLLRKIPCFSRSYENFLKEYGYTYTLTEDGCLVEPDDCSMEELTLPVYVFHAIKGTYVLTEKKHTELIPTTSHYEAGCALKEKIEEQHKEYVVVKNERKYNVLLEEVAKECKERLGSNDACFISRFTTEIKFPDGKYYFDKFLNDLTLYYNINVFEAHTRGGLGCFIGYSIVDLSKVKNKISFKMVVEPGISLGHVVGAGAANIKMLVYHLNSICNTKIKKITCEQ